NGENTYHRSEVRGQTNDEARMTNDEGMTKHECNVLVLARAHARNRRSENRRQRDCYGAGLMRGRPAAEELRIADFGSAFARGYSATSCGFELQNWVLGLGFDRWQSACFQFSVQCGQVLGNDFLP